MTQSYDVANAKSRLAELLNRASIGKERFLIRRHGRPVAAIVSTDDLALLEREGPSKRGLLAAVGAASDFEEWATSIEEVVSMRSSANERDIELD